MNIFYLFTILGLFLIVFLWVIIHLFVSKAERKMLDKFKALSFDISEKSNKSFLDLASTYFEKYNTHADFEFKQSQKTIENVIAPLKESIEKLEKQNREIEKERNVSYSALNEQVKNLVLSEKLLREETYNLTKALKSPNIRGAWGQIHLKRVVELSGLLESCDFYEQKSFLGDDSKVYRPDLVVKLPGDRQVIVDAKTPIDAYLESIELKEDNLKKQKLEQHAKHLKKHIKDLSSKSYWKNSDFSPEYVILFLPAEAFFSAALQVDPTLIETGAKENVVIATPTTLIAILRSIAFSWRQEKISRNTKEIALLGKELYERLQIMNSHFEKLGKNISSSVDAFNQAISSLETRVLVTARKLKDISTSSEKDLCNLNQITKTTKILN